MAIMMTPGISVPTKITEVDGIGQGSGNSTAQRHAAVMISLPYTALREATRERERWRWPTAKVVVGGGQVEEGLVGVVCLFLPWGPFI
jgi:hypothetical protein